MAAAVLWIDNLPESAVVTVVFLISPVASAITLPPFPRPSRLSMRSGVETSTKDAIRVIIRGTAMKRSLRDGLKMEVALEADVINWSSFEIKGVEEDSRVAGDTARATPFAIALVDVMVLEDILLGSDC